MKEDPNSIIDQTEQIINTKTELYTLKLSGKLAKFLASFISQIFFGLVGIVILLLLALGFSLWLGESLGNSYSGFLIIGSALAFLCLIVFLFRYQIIQKPIMNSVISQLLKEKDNA